VSADKPVRTPGVRRPVKSTDRRGRAGAAKAHGAQSAAPLRERAKRDERSAVAREFGGRNPEVSAKPAAAPVPSKVTLVEVGAGGDGQRLDAWLVKRFKDIPKSKLYRIVRKGEVRVNKGRAKPETRLSATDVVRLPPLTQTNDDQPKRVPDRLQRVVESALVFEDDDVLVIAKPSGLAVHGGSGLDFGVIEALRASRPRETLELAHRLDRDTSGLLLVARHRRALIDLHALLRDGLIEKRYLALVKGPWNLGEKRIDAPLLTEARVSGLRKVRVGEQGKEAQSNFRPVDFFGSLATLMEVKIETGRTHQIRVHAAFVGHPLAGDDRYGDHDFNEQIKQLGVERLFLHAQSLSFEWPNGKTFDVSQPLPEDLNQALGRLAQYRKQASAQKAERAFRGGRRSR